MREAAKWEGGERKKRAQLMALEKAEEEAQRARWAFLTRVC